MAEDNEIKPIALATATVMLRKLNEENSQLQEGEFLPAASSEGEAITGPNLSETILKLFESIDATLLRIEQNFDEMFRQMAVDRLAMLEAKAEEGGDRVKKEQIQQQRNGDDGMDLGFLFTPLGVLAATIGTAVGVLQGQFTAFTTFFKTFFPETSAKITKSVGEFTKAVSARITQARVALSEGMKSVGNFFRGIGNSIKAVITENKVLSGLATKIKTFFEPFGKVATIADDVGKAGGPLQDVVKRFSSIGGMLKTFGQTVAKVASIVGKIFAPLAVILTLWDTVKGTFAGFEEGGFIGAIQGAIEGFVTSLITKPLDLLKDGVSWIAEKLGFENFAEILDSFSFTDMFQKLADAVFFIPKKIQEFLVDLFSGEVDMDYLKNAFGNMAEFAQEALKSMLRFVLPSPDSWAAKFVPDAVYEFANAPSPKEENADLKKDVMGNPNEVSQREQELQTKKEPTKVGVFTKDGYKKLTKEEIQQGREDKTIERRRASDALREISIIERAEANEKKQEQQPGVTVVSPESTTAIVPLQQEEKKSSLSGLFSSDDEVSVTPTSTNQRMETAQNLAAQTAEREEAKATQAQANVNVVNAPTSTTNNVSSQAAFFESPSATDGLGLSYGS